MVQGQISDTKGITQYFNNSVSISGKNENDQGNAFLVSSKACSQATSNKKISVNVSRSLKYSVSYLVLKRDKLVSKPHILNDTWARPHSKQFVSLSNRPFARWRHFTTPFAVHYQKIRNHLRKTATNSAKLHWLARKSEHLRINQIQ